MPGLNEINWGVIEGNKLVDESKHRYSETIKNWKSGNYDSRIENGESILDVVERLKKVIDIILRQNNENNILLVTHSRTLKILLCILLKIEIKKMDIFTHKNFTFYKMLYKDHKINLVEKYSLEYSSNHSIRKIFESHCKTSEIN